MTGFPGAGHDAEAVTKFWSDMMSAMGSSAVPQAPTQADILKQMRRAFFDAWAVKCEEFLGSDAFLTMMKQSMENSLSFREKTNEFLKQSLSGAQMPSRDDTAAILIAVRGLQEKMIDKLDAVEQRVAALESQPMKTSAKDKSS